jgi:hypothetical protein
MGQERFDYGNRVGHRHGLLIDRELQRTQPCNVINAGDQIGGLEFCAQTTPLILGMQHVPHFAADFRCRPACEISAVKAVQLNRFCWCCVQRSFAELASQPPLSTGCHCMRRL